MAEEPEDKIGSEQSIENVFTARESNCILFSWETYPLNAPVSTSVVGISLLFIATTTPRLAKIMHTCTRHLPCLRAQPENPSAYPFMGNEPGTTACAER